MMPLMINPQMIEGTLAYQKKKELVNLFDDRDLAKFKGWLHKEDVKDLQAVGRNVITNDGWKKDNVCFLKTMNMWPKSLGHAIDQSIYKGKKHMEKLRWWT